MGKTFKDFKGVYTKKGPPQKRKKNLLGKKH